MGVPVPKLYILLLLSCSIKHWDNTLKQAIASSTIKRRLGSYKTSFHFQYLFKIFVTHNILRCKVIGPAFNFKVYVGSEVFNAVRIKVLVLRVMACVEVTSFMKMEATAFSETLVTMYQTTWYNNEDDYSLKPQAWWWWWWWWWWRWRWRWRWWWHHMRTQIIRNKSVSRSKGFL
jgi:hypothetical protein